MNKKWVSSIALSGLLFAGLPHGNVLADTDTTVPNYESIKVDKNKVTGGDTVKVSVKANDEESGIKSVEVVYKYQASDDSQSVKLTYNEESKEYEGQIPINGYSMNLNGLFVVYYLLITDNEGNTLRVYNTGVYPSPQPYKTIIENLNAANISVSGSDLKPPKYQSINIDNTEMKIGDKLNVSVGAIDSESGIDYATIKFTNTDTGQISPTLTLKINEFTQMYEGALNIDDSFDKGKWVVSQLTIYDNNKNALYLYNKSIQLGDPNAIDFSKADFVVTDDTPPIIKGVEDNKYYNDNVTPTFNKGTATLDGKPFKSGTTVATQGQHKLVVTDKFGNTTTVNFTIDVIAPSVYGLNPNGGVYNNVTIWFDEGDTATLNGEPLPNNTDITKEGDYTVVVTDKANNKSTVHFTIDSTAPIISGVTDNAKYNTDVTAKYNEGSGKLNFFFQGNYENRSFESGETFTKNGEYTLLATDKAGNETKVKFIIDKEPPLISSVENGKIYVTDVLPDIYDDLQIKSVTLNGEPYKLGTKITKDGNYTLVATDELGNLSTVKFSIDKTPPEINGIDMNTSNYYYNKDITITFNEGKSTLNGEPYSSGTKITKEGEYRFRLEDSNGNSVNPYFVIDRTAPNAPTVSDVTSATTTITGTSEPESKIKIISGTKILASTTTFYDGNYRINIPSQEAGTKLLITATDRAGNTSAPKEFSVRDTEKPVFSGIQADFIPVNSKFDPKSGVTARDNVDGDVTKNIKVSGDLDIHKVGRYILTYSVSDKAGNTETVLIKVNVFDDVGPAISGVNDKVIPLNSSFDPKSGVTAKDNADGDLTKLIKITGSVNTKVKGVYALTYSVSDKSGNESKITRRITVNPPDTVKPTIFGVSNKVVTMNTAFDSKSGVTARDNIDGDLTKAIKVTGSVNTKVKGTYALTYTVTDKAGNTASVARKITVLDNVLPVIKGATNKTVSIYSKFDSTLGVTAKDNIDGDLTKVIKVTGSVNTKVKGTYTLTYTVTDKAGNTAAVVRKVTVADISKPVIAGATNKSLPLNSKFDAKAGVTAKDNVDGDITKLIKISGTVNTKVKGIYSVIYTVKDKAGNISTITRKITIFDNVKPVISGAINKTIKLNSSFNPRTGVSAKDNVDGDLTKIIQIGGTVNTKKKGIYTLTYSVSDKSGNKITVARKITVN
ncbi:immunoglobulin-like domain-containing protein [Priestia aryabhattai]